MSFPFEFAWLNASHAVRHSHTYKALATPLDGRTCVGLGIFIEHTLQRGQTAHHGDDVCGESLC
jgi:hypothetical protein